jgi:23S rRNA pseudouridine2605 synthase
VEVLGRRIRAARAPVYVALHKPRGYVTTVKDPEGRSTVMELVQRVGERVYPVGRLDYTAEGLLLMTNDGAMAYALMRPGGAPKTYRVKVKGTPAPDALDRLRRGATLDGRTLLPAKVHLESRGETAWLRVTLHEGKKNQIVRMMDQIGHPVRRLRRLAVGPVQLGALPAGKWRFLTPEEIAG